MQRLLRRRIWRQESSPASPGSHSSKSSVASSPRSHSASETWDTLTEGLHTHNFDFNLESMEEELTCPVCLELYADPLMLPCSHSICKKCLQDILDIKTKRKKLKKDLVLDCPSCRKEVHLNKEKLEGLPRNLALENVVIRYTEERSKSIRKSLSVESPVADMLFGPPAMQELDLPTSDFPTDSNVPCDLCEGGNVSNAIYYCVQCEVSYCHSCFAKFHPKRGALAKHKIRPVEEGDKEKESEEKCRDHKEETATLFCDKCKVLVCFLCVCEGEGNHAGHSVLAPETASKKVKEKFDKTKEDSDALLATLLEHKGKIDSLNIEVTDLYKEAEVKVEMQFTRFQEDMLAALAMQKEKALKSLENAKSSYLDKTKTYLNDNTLQIQELQDLSHMCHKATDDKRVKKILEKAKEVSPVMSNLQKYQKKVENLAVEYENTVKDKSAKAALQTTATDYGQTVLSMFRVYFDNEPPEASVPLILSQVPGDNSELTPRVQNKCLTTWGFPSTTFTAEPQTDNCTWTITVEKNQGQIGSINSGYLFGIGISTHSLNVKNLVGIAENTYGLLCSMGRLQFGQSGENMEDITSLDSLPMTITVNLNFENNDSIIFTYNIETCTEGQMSSLIGKKLITKNNFQDCIHPVFTVSQRVKLLFPTCV